MKPPKGARISAADACLATPYRGKIHCPTENIHREASWSGRMTCCPPEHRSFGPAWFFSHHGTPSALTLAWQAHVERQGLAACTARGGGLLVADEPTTPGFRLSTTPTEFIPPPQQPPLEPYADRVIARSHVDCVQGFMDSAG